MYDIVVEKDVARPAIFDMVIGEKIHARKGGLITSNSQNTYAYYPKDGVIKPAPHFKYMKKCLDEQIDLPIDEPKKKSIYSFKNARVVTGYDKVKI